MRASCHHYTFDDLKIRKLVISKIEGKLLNLFAGKNRLCISEVRVDNDPDLQDIDYRMDVGEFLSRNHLKFDTIIYDPPWNERKSKEFYNGRYIGRFTKLKDNIVNTLNHNGKIISIGYEIDNFGSKRGMLLEEVVVINPSGEIRPFFITIERKIRS